MAKSRRAGGEKKPAEKSRPARSSDDPAAPSTESCDPHDVLRRPANPPRGNLIAFLIAVALFFAWFVYLVFVVWRG
jgi:hypothetical protein